ncbi:unnamed protein product [Amoebophrya sp. A25]|nr:unnamed protein product [Amoebophrya sp. A25]|eukprot:GSA25T00012174001.1
MLAGGDEYTMNKKHNRFNSLLLTTTLHFYLPPNFHHLRINEVGSFSFPVTHLLRPGTCSPTTVVHLSWHRDQADRGHIFVSKSCTIDENYVWWTWSWSLPPLLKWHDSVFLASKLNAS